MIKTYLITLTPMDTYFFGEESKYRKKKPGEDKINFEADYFQRSSLFPQQTTLIGALRYLILQQKNWLPITNENREAVNAAIGKNSFSAATNNEFGWIKQLSPAFIIKNGKKYLPNPNDVILKDGVPELLMPQKAPFISNLGEGKKMFLPEFNEKEGLNNFLLNYGSRIEMDCSINSYDRESKAGVFIEKTKIGITKDKKGNREKENSILKKAFYKQTSYGLNNSSFALYANIDNSDSLFRGIKKIESFLSIGAEKSIFKVVLEEQGISVLENDNYVTQFLKDNTPILYSKLFSPAVQDVVNNECWKIILLSDTYIQDYGTCVSKASLAISKTVPFRFFRTNTRMETKNYNQVRSIKEVGSEKAKVKFGRSERYNLLKRGSVFYFSNEADLNNFIAAIEVQKNFQRIGYNYFIAGKTN